MKKRGLILVVLLCVIGSLFASGAQEKTGPKEINFWFWGAATPYQETMKKVLAENYNNSQSEYVLNIEFRNTVDKDIPVALAAGSAPDIIYASGPSYTSKYAEEGMVLNLNDYAEQYGWKDRILEVMYNACTVNDNLYSIPGGMCIGGLYYNKELFKEKSYEVPQTWDELITLMDRAKADGLYPLGAGNKGWKPCNDHFSSMIINHYGGADLIYNALMGNDSFDNPGMVNSVAESARWFDVGYLAGQDYINFDSQEVMQLLADKRCAMVMAPSLYTQFAAQSFLPEQADDVGFVYMPSRNTDEAVYDISLNCNFSISADSEYPDECAKILDYMLSNEFATEMTAGWPGYWTVPIKDLVNSDASKLTGLSKMTLESFQEAIDQIDKGYFAYHPSTFFPPATATIFQDIDTVWQKVRTAEEFCKSVDNELKNELDIVSPLTEPKVK